MLNKKSIPNNKKAFTLIEILIVMAIIGILATVTFFTINIARNRAKDNSFKSVVKNIQTGLVSCCVGSTTVLLPNYDPNTGSVICAGSGQYPDLGNVASIAGSAICDSSGTFTKIIKPGTRNHGTIDYAEVTAYGVTYYNTP